MSASVAVRLPTTTLQTLGLIINGEYAELCLSNTNIDSGDCVTAQQTKATMDCRVYENILKLQSLYASSAFMNAKTKQAETAQVNCLYRLRDVCRNNGFKSVQHTNVTKQFLLAQRGETVW